MERISSNSKGKRGSQRRDGAILQQQIYRLVPWEAAYDVDFFFEILDNYIEKHGRGGKKRKINNEVELIEEKTVEVNDELKEFLKLMGIDLDEKGEET